MKKPKPNLKEQAQAIQQKLDMCIRMAGGDVYLEPELKQLRDMCSKYETGVIELVQLIYNTIDKSK